MHALLAPEVAERMIFDLGLVRSLGYYTGAVFQVYDPAYGVPIGSGGRYDELLGQFGRPLPAVGFALNVERLHIALTGEERGRESQPVSELRIAVPRGALFGDTLDLLDRLGIDTARGPRERPQAAVRGRRDRDDAPVGRPDLRRGGRRRPRHHRQGRADGAVRARGLRAGRPRLRRAARWCSPAVAGEDRAAEALRRLGRRPDRDQVPADRRRATSSRPAARRRSSRSRGRSSWRR